MKRKTEFSGQPDRYVLIPRFCAATGFTVKAVQRKIEDGVWLQNQVWRKGPDGHIYIDMEGYRSWVAGDRVAA